MNLYHVTKFSLNLSATVLYFSKKTVFSRYFHPLEFFLDHCLSLFSILRISWLESHVYRKRDSKSFYYQDRICHFRNEKGTGAKMHPSVVSGIVTGDTHWSAIGHGVFVPVPSNSPRSNNCNLVLGLKKSPGYEVEINAEIITVPEDAKNIFLVPKVFAKINLALFPSRFLKGWYDTVDPVQIENSSGHVFQAREIFPKNLAIKSCGFFYY